MSEFPSYGGFGPVFSLDGITPKIAPDAFIAPTAAVIGDVEIGSETGIWFHCLVRGDLNIIRIGARTNIQDGTIIHIDTGPGETHIGDDVTVGHNAVIHACVLKNRAFVGIGATVLDGAVIEEGGMLAAGGLLDEPVEAIRARISFVPSLAAALDGALGRNGRPAGRPAGQSWRALVSRNSSSP